MAERANENRPAITYYAIFESDGYLELHKSTVRARVEVRRALSERVALARIPEQSLQKVWASELAGREFEAVEIDEETLLEEKFGLVRDHRARVLAALAADISRLETKTNRVRASARHVEIERIRREE